MYAIHYILFFVRNHLSQCVTFNYKRNFLVYPFFIILLTTTFEILLSFADKNYSCVEQKRIGTKTVGVARGSQLAKASVMFMKYRLNVEESQISKETRLFLSFFAHAKHACSCSSS